MWENFALFIWSFRRKARFPIFHSEKKDLTRNNTGQSTSKFDFFATKHWPIRVTVSGYFIGIRSAHMALKVQKKISNPLYFFSLRQKTKNKLKQDDIEDFCCSFPRNLYSPAHFYRVWKNSPRWNEWRAILEQLGASALPLPDNPFINCGK